MGSIPMVNFMRDDFSGCLSWTCTAEFAECVNIISIEGGICSLMTMSRRISKITSGVPTYSRKGKDRVGMVISS
jgi:hypothetical protein